MKLLGLSEFTFGFAYLYEQTQVNWNNLKAVPIIPSLQQEGGKGNEDYQGWDAHLQLKRGIDYYYQFKLSDYLDNRRAKYFEKGPGRGAYYRFPLHRKNNYQQHQALRKLSRKKRFTYYVAPEFNPSLYTMSHFGQIASLNQIFLHQNIRNNSRLIPLSKCQDCEINDPRQHYMIFRTGHKSKIFSDFDFPEIDTYDGKNLEKIYRGNENEWQNINDRFFLDLFKNYSEIIYEFYDEIKLLHRTNMKYSFDLLDFDPSSLNKEEMILRLSQILMIFFNSVLVLVGEPKLNHK